jgi:hypothetical protein
LLFHVVTLCLMMMRLRCLVRIPNVNLGRALSSWEHKQAGNPSIGENAVKRDGYADCDLPKVAVFRFRFAIIEQPVRASFPSESVVPVLPGRATDMITMLSSLHLAVRMEVKSRPFTIDAESVPFRSENPL